MPPEEDKEHPSKPAKDELSEDSFYLNESIVQQHDDFQQIMRSAWNSKGVDIQNADSKLEDSLQEVVVKNVIRRFNIDENSSEIVGFLRKKSDGFIKSWNKRYIVIRDNELYYFRSPKDRRIRGYINFDVCNWSVNINKKKSIIKILIKGIPSEICFKADSMIQAESWKEIIQLQIDKYNGKVNQNFKGSEKLYRLKEIDFKNINFFYGY